MNAINDYTSKKQQHGLDETKGLEKMETRDTFKDGKEAIRNIETLEKAISKKAKCNEHNKKTSDLNTEDDTEAIAEIDNQSDKDLKTGKKVAKHEHSKKDRDKKENDRNESNNKKRQTIDNASENKEISQFKDTDEGDKTKECVKGKDDFKNKDKDDDNSMENSAEKENVNKIDTKDVNVNEDIAKPKEKLNNRNVNVKESMKKKENPEHRKMTKGCANDDSTVTTKQKTLAVSTSEGDLEKNYNNKTEHDNASYEVVNEEIDDGEFEDVEVPEEVDELIVPDDETGNDDLSTPENEDDDDDDEEHDKAISNDEEATKDTDEDRTKLLKGSEEEEEESSHSAIEPELVSMEDATKDTNSMEDQSNNDDEVSNITASDPLNCLETPEVEDDSNVDDKNGADSNGGHSTNCDLNKGDDDDDDVQFVETRNSPICIESDDDDSTGVVSVNGCTATTSNHESDLQTITLPSTTITVPKALTVTRTSARKSTARPQFVASPPRTVPHIQNNLKNFAYLNKATNYRRSMPAFIPAASIAVTSRKVVDTIELLDSSDEETTIPAHNKSLPPQFKTPPKRTLLAAKSVNNKVSIKPVNLQRDMPTNFSQQIRKQPKKPAPPPLPPPTPQSNFLNAVQLQPATAGVNPPTFSALLSNKSVIIPNAFYGNPPNIRGNSIEVEAERRYARWLDNFITQFCNPQLVASHSCFVFLQRALKYKDFVRIKNIRTNLNMHAQIATDQLNHQLMLDLRSIFLKNSKEITTHGRRFCELTCSMMQNKSVTLLVHGVTSRVIMKTCNMEFPKSTLSSGTISSSSSSPSTSNSTNSSSSNRKRQLEEDEDEYVPGKNKIKTKPPPATAAAVDNTEDSSDLEGPKRSLRSKRAKRLDNSFSYNEDDLAEYDIEDDEEEAERQAQAEIQRKIDQKRLEAQIQRQQQAKSFESAFLQAFAKSLDDTDRTSNSPPTNNSKSTNHRTRIDDAITHHAVHNDAEDLLQATWIENVENEDTQVISDDEEPREHRIYKQQQQQQQKQKKQLMRQQQLQRSLRNGGPNENDLQEDGGTDPRNWPKNTDPQFYANAKNKDTCVICKLNVQRIVHHYVNEHRGCEVYNSRLTPSQLEQLKRGSCNIINVSIYKNGQPQYEAHCVFCQKQSRFMLPYWFQHFTMHTGEYAYRCSGCGVRKPTRSLLTQHQSQGCPNGGNVLQDYSHDVKKARVEARICTLCNYVQLHRNNIVKHLHQQHNIKQILPKHIQTIVLLKDQSAPGPSMPTPELTVNRRKQRTSPPASSTSSNIVSYVVDDDDDTLLFGDDALPPVQQYQQQQQSVSNTENQYYNYVPPYMMNSSNQNFTWEENDPSDDLSFMICGMLDVQMNTTD